MTKAIPTSDPAELRARLEALPGVKRVRALAGENPVYLVGGAVRDLLLGRERADVDLVVAGDAVELARSLGEPVVHERFGTATVSLDGHPVDLATARAESYERPGALPTVRPGTLEEDLARRDFTINAMALPLDGPQPLVDPHEGAADLTAGSLRVLHERSFSDDPTRALRAARYAARLDLELEARTAELLAGADLATVSAERVEAELRRIAAEPSPAAGLRLAAGWGLLELDAEALEVVEAAGALLEDQPWSSLATMGDIVVAIVQGDVGTGRELASQSPASPSEAVALAHGRGGGELALARAMGGEWLDRYVTDLRHVRLEIDGSDLLAHGVAEGPAVGRGLRAALRARLDGEVAGADEELELALRVAGEADARR
jgi:tRNA nucleotidyltransferase (CCA-adding enzyme)